MSDNLLPNTFHTQNMVERHPSIPEGVGLLLQCSVIVDVLYCPQGDAGQEDTLIVQRQTETGELISANPLFTLSEIISCFMDVYLLEGIETMAEEDRPEGQVR